MENRTSLLTICIPTYNRGQLLEQSIQKMIPVCKEHNIQICISDNASTDDTNVIMAGYLEAYPFIHYYRQKENIGSDDNFEFVLKMAQTKYRWLMSDTTFVTDIKDLIDDLIAKDFDGFVVNGDPKRAQHLPKVKKFYHESISLMDEVGWHMTWISCMIYNEKLIDSMNFKRYKNSSFNQTALMFETTANRYAELGFNPGIVVGNLPIRKESGWLYHEFDVIYRQFYLMIMSLPLYYPYEIKKKCIIDSVKYPGILSKYWHVVRRIEGKWSFRDVQRNSFFIKQAQGDYYFYSIVGLCSPRLLKIFLPILRHLRLFFFRVFKK